MIIDFSIEFEPQFASFERGLKSDLEKVSKDIVREVTELAPAEMRDLMGNNPPSLYGSPPVRRTGNLNRSLRGEMIGNSMGQISMAGYAEYLDPFLGGKLNRPFIASGIDKALVKIAGDL